MMYGGGCSHPAIRRDFDTCVTILRMILKSLSDTVA
jgi:hypothetical protein